MTTLKTLFFLNDPPWFSCKRNLSLTLVELGAERAHGLATIDRSSGWHVMYARKVSLNPPGKRAATSIFLIENSVVTLEI